MLENSMNCNTCSKRQDSAFKCLNDEALDILNKAKTYKKFRKGESLFSAGESAEKYYCILSGNVRTFKVSKENNKEQTFEIKSGGDWAGFRDMVLNSNHNHNAICLTDVEACVVPKTILDELQSDLEFQKELLQQVARQYRRAESQIYSLGTKQIHSKLAEFLICLYESNNKQKHIHLEVTREVIASIIGTTTESVIRALSDFKARDWIAIDKTRISFLNLNALKAMSEIEDSEIGY